MPRIHHTLGGIAIAALLVTPALSRAAGEGPGPHRPFIHVEVREGDGEEATVQVHLPLAAAQVAIEAFQGEVNAHTRSGFDHTHLQVSDLRRIWNEMRESGDTEYVSVLEHGDKVRISRQGATLVAEVTERDAAEVVRIHIPVVVVDALLAGPGEQLDLQGAAAALSRAGTGEIVRIEDAGDFVRIWID